MVEKKTWTRPPIQIEFQVPMFAASRAAGYRAPEQAETIKISQKQSGFWMVIRST